MSLAVDRRIYRSRFLRASGIAGVVASVAMTLATAAFTDSAVLFFGSIVWLLATFMIVAVALSPTVDIGSSRITVVNPLQRYVFDAREIRDAVAAPTLPYIRLRTGLVISVFATPRPRWKRVLRRRAMADDLVDVLNTIPREVDTAPSAVAIDHSPLHRAAAVVLAQAVLTAVVAVVVTTR
jgi:hypothetical protein